MTDADPVTAGRLETTALRILALRDHSIRELDTKLRARGFAPEAIEPLLQHFQDCHYLDDARFAQRWIESRCEQGFGPERIRLELREKGLDSASIQSLLDPGADCWLTPLRRLYAKKFGPQPPATHHERLRRLRYLAQRGYNQTQLSRLWLIDEDIEPGDAPHVP